MIKGAPNGAPFVLVCTFESNIPENICKKEKHNKRRKNRMENAVNLRIAQSEER